MQVFQIYHRHFLNVVWMISESSVLFFESCIDLSEIIILKKLILLANLKEICEILQRTGWTLKKILTNMISLWFI